MLDIHRLKIFSKIAELKSYSNAAQALYLTQPTVSQHMAALENYIGLKLFDRVGKEVQLTSAGEMLYRYAKNIVSMAEEAQQSLDAFRGKKQGHITIGASTIPGEFILPELLGRFSEKYPDIKATMRIGDTEDIVHELLNRDVELGVVGAKVKDSRLQFSRFMDDDLVLVVPRGHRWWLQESVEVTALVEEPFVMRERGSGTRLAMERHLKKAGVDPDQLHITTMVGSTTAVKQAVKAGLGVSLLSSRAVQEEVEHTIFKIVPVIGAQFTRTFYIVQDKKRTASPLCKVFVQFLLKGRKTD